MAFRIRRGTNTDRLSITPDEGELLYTTDTENVYIGDGSTVGGKLLTTSIINDTSPELSANLDLGGNNIVGTGNINIDGTITATGNINLGDGAEDNVIVGGQIQSSLIPTADGVYDIGASASAWRQGFFESVNIDTNLSAESVQVTTIYKNDSSVFFKEDVVNADLAGSVLSSDSTVLIDQTSGNANLTDISAEDIVLSGTITVGNNVNAQSFNGDLYGSVFGGDSTRIVDQLRSTITTGLHETPDNLFNFSSANAGETVLQLRSAEDRSVMKLARTSQSDLSASPDTIYGSVLFERQDINGALTTSLIAGTDKSIVIVPDSTGSFTDESKFFKFTNDGFFGVGTDNPAATLDVRGEVVTTSFVQFGSFTSTERNNLSAVNGMVIYNTTDNKFQGYQNDAWINLDDGTAA